MWTTDKILLRHNYIFGDPLIRLTIREFNKVENPISETSDVIPFIRHGDDITLFTSPLAEENTASYTA
jgi:hypothetical protein